MVKPLSTDEMFLFMVSKNAYPVSLVSNEQMNGVNF